MRNEVIGVYTEHRAQIFLTITKGRMKMPGGCTSSEERSRIQVTKYTLCSREKKEKRLESCKEVRCQKRLDKQSLRDVLGTGAKVTP